MADILDEALADQIVCRNIFNARKGQRGIRMSKYLFDEQGNIYKVHSFEAVSLDDLTAVQSDLQTEYKGIGDLVAAHAKLSVVDAPVASEVPVPAVDPTTPVETPAPVVEPATIVPTPVTDTTLAQDTTATIQPLQ
jgi:hypothetical protein